MFAWFGLKQMRCLDLLGSLASKLALAGSSPTVTPAMQAELALKAGTLAGALATARHCIDPAPSSDDEGKRQEVGKHRLSKHSKENRFCLHFQFYIYVH